MAGPDQATAVAAALGGNRTLTMLKYARPQRSEWRALRHVVRRRSLAECSVGDEGAIALAQALCRGAGGTLAALRCALPALSAHKCARPLTLCWLPSTGCGRMALETQGRRHWRRHCATMARSRSWSARRLPRRAPVVRELTTRSGGGRSLTDNLIGNAGGLALAGALHATPSLSLL